MPVAAWHEPAEIPAGRAVAERNRWASPNDGIGGRHELFSVDVVVTGTDMNKHFMF